ncbi:Facilitated trehalose transporter Tret1-2 homolog-like Protein [Tribolium castaneum]|uniref:Facilitated trehalose transporter Tret1-2 homolog-like Protein n=1 Tax=Tribolium castaneum TaxID=7070 RepID=D6WDA8_TRICA|nr:PREDICTED: facilitated trehalose transporter Tret1 [Tribolium castaneum]XP_015833489.1 PREDICTED: facilitated trehalose transporter Tret1 [Tribolium castaneum]XP_970477.3 PREDICTED: facilitated trehalose transporter Tret1 [Tribolium castaneum]EEZ99539.1 Facilitated trehalose transporter Tret1-2 homolog-like Protein [Tribolium castaneum]|eukprot:XP_008199543.1 PREDICTED: facilitated trehalose transporter Tret1 [Tribolium castaneum]
MRLFNRLTNTMSGQKSQIFPQILATTIVSWLSIIVGYSSAYYSPAESTMITDLNMTKNEASWVCSLLPVGALVGSLSGGPSLDWLGRKGTLILTDMFFLTAWCINYFSTNCWTMYTSRILNGLSVGIASFALPVYLAETLEPEIRGRLGLFPTAFGNFGILLCFVTGSVFEWRGLAGIGALLTVPFLGAVWVVPETPRWYMSKRRVQRAQRALQWFGYSDKGLQDLNQNKPKLRYSKSHLKVLGIVLGLMFFQQFSGINAIIFYTTRIFQEAGSSLNASLCTAIIGLVNFISTFIAAILVDRLGRKALMYTSSAVMALMLAVLGLYFYLLRQGVELGSLEWLPLSCFIFYVLGFSFGWGPIPWLMMGEILPAVIRGQAASISAAFNWSCTFIITKTFPLFVDSVGAHYAFWFFCIFMICSMVFLKLAVPETKKRTLEDIERILASS